MKLEQLSQATPLESIDWRVQSVSAKGYCIILGYKDARYDMNALDAAVGPQNWQKEYAIIGGNLFCGVSIRSENGEWVTKWDVGTESNTEKEKGQASDAFKRACFNWGIGRDLYDLPFIQLKLKDNEFKPDGNKGKTTWDFRLKEWTWTREDGKLVGRDEGGETRYIEGEKFNTPRGDGKGKPAAKKAAPKPPANSENVGKDVSPKAEPQQIENIKTLQATAKISDADMSKKIASLKSGKTKIEELNKAEAAIIIGALTNKIENK